MLRKQTTKTKFLSMALCACLISGLVSCGTQGSASGPNSGDGPTAGVVKGPVSHTFAALDSGLEEAYVLWTARNRLRTGRCLEALELLTEAAEETGSSLLAERAAYVREHLVVAVCTEYDNGELSTREEYDTEGHLIVKEVYDRPGVYHVDKTDRYEYEYDQLGRERVVRAYVDGMLRCLTEYDAMGNQITRLYYDEEGNLDAEQEIWNRESQLNADGNPVKTFGGHGNRWEYTYDENGRLTVITQYYGTMETARIDAVYQYAEDGQTYIKTVYHGEYSSHDRTESGYFLDGTEIFEFTYNEDGSIWRGVRREYDDQGRRTAIEEYYDGEFSSCWVTEYNEAGQEVSNICYGDEERQIPLYGYTSEYDSQGHLVRETGLDGSIAREYERNGNQVRYISYRSDGSVDTHNTGIMEYDIMGSSLCQIADEGSINYVREFQYAYTGEW